MQEQGLQTFDYLVFLFYFILVSSYGYWIYNRKKAKETTTQDFFLAEGPLRVTLIWIAPLSPLA